MPLSLETVGRSQMDTPLEFYQLQVVETWTTQYIDKIAEPAKLVHTAKTHFRYPKENMREIFPLECVP